MRKTHIVALLLIVASMGVIIAMIGDYSRYETFATAESSGGREFHIVGELVRREDMQYDPEIDPNYFSFYLKDKAGDERKVVFHDTKPTDFERAEQIVLTGKMNGNEFHASKILMKCPSKYINNDLEVMEVTAGT